MNHLPINIKAYLFSSTSKDSFYLMGGTIVSTLLNFLIVFLLTSHLSPEGFGLFITALSFSLLLTDLLALGIGASVLNFVPTSQEPDKSAYIKAALTLRVFTYSILSLLIVLFSSEISQLFFKDNNIQPFIFISVIGIWLLALVFMGQVILQSLGKYLKSAILNTSMNFFRFGTVLLLIYFGIDDGDSLYLGFNLALVLSAALMFYFIGLTFIKAKIKKQHFLDILKFGLPLGASFAVAAVFTRLDQILVFNLAGEKEAGIYGLAFRIATVFIFLADAINMALIPRFVSYSREHYNNYFKKVFLVILTFGILITLTIPFDQLLIDWFFGDDYINSVMPLQILTLGMVFFTLTSPFHTALVFKFKKTKFPLFISIFSLMMIYLLLNFLIPRYQSTGAALSVTIVYFFVFIISLFFYQFTSHDQ